MSIFGTGVTDFLTDTVNVSLYASTVLFAVILAIVFFVWHRQEMTLSIAAINTTRRERFYWGAILTTFALGTAAGDLATEALNLGFRNGTLIFGSLLLVALLAWRIEAWHVFTFWSHVSLPGLWAPRSVTFSPKTTSTVAWGLAQAAPVCCDSLSP